MNNNKTKLTGSDLKKFKKALSEKIAEACDEYGIEFSISDLNPSIRGIMTPQLRMVKKSYLEARKAMPYHRERGQTQPEMRFQNYYEQLGFRQEDLHGKFILNGEEFELMGLKGRNHKVVLRSVKNPLNGEVEYSLIDFFKLSSHESTLR